MRVLSGACAYSMRPFLHLHIRTCACNVRSTSISPWSVFHLSVSVFSEYKCVWRWDLVVSSPSLSMNSERWRKEEKKKKERKRGGGGGWIQSALCENCPRVELKQQGEREAAAGEGEERRVFICSSARGKRRWRGERGREGGIGRGEGERRSVFICWSGNVRVHEKVIEGGERTRNRVKGESIKHRK